MDRRSFIRDAGLAGAGASVLAAPAVAQGRKTLTMVSTWGRDFPGLGTGAQRLAERITALSEGTIQVEYFAARERVGAFDSFVAARKDVGGWMNPSDGPYLSERNRVPGVE